MSFDSFPFDDVSPPSTWVDGGCYLRINQNLNGRDKNEDYKNGREFFLRKVFLIKVSLELFFQKRKRYCCVIGNKGKR